MPGDFVAEYLVDGGGGEKPNTEKIYRETECFKV